MIDRDEIVSEQIRHLAAQGRRAVLADVLIVTSIHLVNADDGERELRSSFAHATEPGSKAEMVDQMMLDLRAVLELANATIHAMTEGKWRAVFQHVETGAIYGADVVEMISAFTSVED
jgi:hypothetical protein